MPIPMCHDEHVADRSRFGRLDKQAHHRRRNVVDGCVGRLKEGRRICMRFAKLTGHFGAKVAAAMTVMYLNLPS